MEALHAFFITDIVRNLSREHSVQRLNNEKFSIICGYLLNRLSRYTLRSGTTHGKDDPHKAQLLLSRFAFVFLAKFSWDGSRLGLELGLAFVRLLLTFSNCVLFFLEDPDNESTFVERIHHWPNNQHGFKRCKSLKKRRLECAFSVICTN